MDSSTTEAQIHELDRVRKQINLWRGGAVATIFAAILLCLGLLVSDVRGLLQQGPTQQAFVGHLQEKMNESIVPRLKEVASSTVTEMQPLVQAEFVRLNERVPELTQASLHQIDELQTSLPKRSAKVLDETFTAALREQEPRIREMFPNATEEQVATLFDNLGRVIVQRGQGLAEELLSPHLAAMAGIRTNLVKIQATEGSSVSKGGDWELGLAVFDVVRDDLKGFAPQQREAASRIAEAAAHVGVVATRVQKEADKLAEDKP